MTTVLDRPAPLVGERSRPREHAHADRAAPAALLAAELVDGRRGQRMLVYVQPDHDHADRLLPLGATGERTDLNRGKLPSSYQVTLDGLREGDGDTTLASRQAPTFGNRVSRRLPESQPTTGQHTPTMTLSSEMSLVAVTARCARLRGLI